MNCFFPSFSYSEKGDYFLLYACVACRYSGSSFISVSLFGLLVAFTSYQFFSLSLSSPSAYLIWVISIYLKLGGFQCTVQLKYVHVHPPTPTQIFSLLLLVEEICLLAVCTSFSSSSTFLCLYKWFWCTKCSLPGVIVSYFRDFCNLLFC